ncbi:MAG TPA: hypothetical protein DEA08_39675 [Planctomycetes bacterium]|nr:hypothetical protein [Planctomycetota bacterium]
MSGDELDRISVASPCTESWEDMRGDDRVRFCGKCEQDVYRLTDLPRVEAYALLERARGGEEICVRYARRADGTIVTNDCPSTIQRGRGGAPLLNVVKTVAAGLAATLGAGLSTGCFEDEPQPVTPAPTKTSQQQPTQQAPVDAPQQKPVEPVDHRIEMGEVALPAPDTERQAQEQDKDPQGIPQRPRMDEEIQGGMCPPEDLRVEAKPQPEREPKLLPIAKEQPE